MLDPTSIDPAHCRTIVTMVGAAMFRSRSFFLPSPVTQSAFDGPTPAAM